MSMSACCDCWAKVILWCEEKQYQKNRGDGGLHDFLYLVLKCVFLFEEVGGLDEPCAVFCYVIVEELGAKVLAYAETVAAAYLYLVK